MPGNGPQAWLSLVTGDVKLIKKMGSASNALNQNDSWFKPVTGSMEDTMVTDTAPGLPSQGSKPRAGEESTWDMGAHRRVLTLGQAGFIWI